MWGMVQFHRPVIIILTEAMTQDVHISLPALAMKHGQHETVIPLWLKLPMLPAREVISAIQIHKVSKRLLWDAQILPSMVSEPVTVLSDVLLGPDHVAGAIVEEEVHQGSLWISLGAQKHMLAVVPALTGSETDFPTCTSQQLLSPFSHHVNRIQSLIGNEKCKHCVQLRELQVHSVQRLSDILTANTASAAVRAMLKVLMLK